MSDQEQTVLHLREVLAKLQIKFDQRTAMLATIIPYLKSEYYGAGGPQMAYGLIDFFRQHNEAVERFIEEYGKEI